MQTMRQHSSDNLLISRKLYNCLSFRIQVIMLVYMTSVTLYVVLSCVYMETKAQDDDTYVHAVLNTTFLNSKLPVRIFSGANGNLLVLTKYEVYSVMTKKLNQTLQVTRSQLVRKFESLFDAVILSSTLILFSDGTTCLKSLSLQDGAIKTYVGNCNETLSRNGPRVEARLQTPKCLARTDTVMYITDEQSSEIKEMALWDGITGSEDAFTSEVSTAFRDTASAIVAPRYMTTCGEGTVYITVLHGVLEVRLQHNDAYFLIGSNTAGLADTDPLVFYRQQPTTTSLNAPQGIIQLRSGLLVVADSLNNRLRFVFPTPSLNGTLTNITVSVCGDGLSSKDGDLQTCVLSRPHSLNLIGYQILIGEPNGMRIVSDYRTAYSELATTFRNVYLEEGIDKLDLTGAMVSQSTVWDNLPSRYSPAFAIDGNFSRFSFTKEIPNQWWKMFLLESTGTLGRIMLYKRDDNCVVAGSTAGVKCYLRLYDLSVLTSTVDEPSDLVPALNDENWILCYYRKASNDRIEDIRCSTKVTNARHIAFYVSQSSGVAIAELEIYGRLPGEVIDLNAFTSCVLPTTQPIVTVPFWKGEFATTGSISTTVPTVERTERTERTTIEHITTNQGVLEESEGGQTLLNIEIGGGIFLAIVSIAGLAVYCWLHTTHRPDRSAAPELRSRRNKSNNSSDLARAIPPQQSVKSLTDANSKREDQLVGPLKSGSSARISASSYDSVVARAISPQRVVQSPLDASSKREDHLVGSTKSGSTGLITASSFISDVSEANGNEHSNNKDRKKKQKKEKKDKKHKRDKKHKKDKKHKQDEPSYHSTGTIVK